MTVACCLQIKMIVVLGELGARMLNGPLQLCLYANLQLLLIMRVACLLQINMIVVLEELHGQDPMMEKSSLCLTVANFASCLLLADQDDCGAWRAGWPGRVLAGQRTQGG
jgi:hypothetical protein